MELQPLMIRAKALRKAPIISSLAESSTNGGDATRVYRWGVSEAGS